MAADYRSADLRLVLRPLPEDPVALVRRTVTPKIIRQLFPKLIPLTAWGAAARQGGLALLAGNLLLCRLLRHLAAPPAAGAWTAELAARLYFTAAAGLAFSPFLWLFFLFH